MINVAAASNRHAGAVLIELAVSIPLLLLIAFFSIWFCVVQNLRAQLEYVVTNAPYVAMARGNPAFYSDGTTGAQIAVVNDFINNGASWTQDQMPRAFRFKAPGANISEDAKAYYDTAGNWAITGYDPDLGGYVYEASSIWNYANGGMSPTPYARFASALVLATAYEGLHMGVGDTLSYPCSPTQPGCAKCRVILPAGNDPDALSAYWGNPLVDPPQLQLICAASPPEPFHTLFKVGMRLFGGDNVPNPILIASTLPGQIDDGSHGGGPEA